MRHAFKTRAGSTILRIVCLLCAVAPAESSSAQSPSPRIVVAPQQIVVAAQPIDSTLASPDPAQRVLVREELLDANPGRAGAPVSLPGLPIESASGGIKAPQYFVPGVAGDHGEPIAQYIAVGNYLVSNNLSANAHGNGYADPNIFVPAALATVSTDGGAFNVLEGNHALNLAAAYAFQQHPGRSFTLTADARDLDVSVALAPRDTDKSEWLAFEVAYGNGLLQRLEHRQQYKWNAMRIFAPAHQQITLLSVGYFGSSYLPGLVPLGLGPELHDTLDPRQRDQTHTAIVAASDVWSPAGANEFSFSGFFRTYSLALFSNFGEGLIRQSEFRTAQGAEVRATHTFAYHVEAMTGLDYNQDNPRRDNLDHFLSAGPQANLQADGAFVKVMANNLQIRELTPFLAARAALGSHLHLYAGLRPEFVAIGNTDLLTPSSSFSLSRSFVGPKATLAFTPGNLHWLPVAALSIGQGFFTEDPRIGLSPSAKTAGPVDPFERSHSAQFVLEKTLHATDVRLTLGQTTTTATLAKIDPDTGLPQDLGPGALKYVTASVRHQFSFGSAQAVFSKADARLLGTAAAPATVTPEAPRTIFDFLATLERMPFGLRGRGEYEYVGHKLLDSGGFEAVPVGETRLAVVRPIRGGRMEIGVNGMLARGATGQTTETFAPNWQPGPAPPFCAGGVNGMAANFDCGTVERSVGVRLPSYVGASISWRLSTAR